MKTPRLIFVMAQNHDPHGIVAVRQACRDADEGSFCSTTLGSSVSIRPYTKKQENRQNNG